MEDERSGPGDRGRGLGPRLLPPRAPGAQAAPLAWMTDFVGMSLRGRRRPRGLHLGRLQRRHDRPHRAPSAGARPGDLRGESRRHRARALLPDLPTSASGPRSIFDFAGYVTGFDTATVADRRRCGGARLLPGRAGMRGHRRRGRGVAGTCCAVSSPPIRTRGAAVPGLRMVVVAGPRIDPAAISMAEGSRWRLPARAPQAPGRLGPGRRAGRSPPDGAGGHLAAVRLRPLRHHFEQ